MRPVLLTFVAIALLVLSTSLTGNAKAEQEDSILKIITIIKSWFESEEEAPIRIEVINRHNGTYIITSHLKRDGDSIQLRSHTKNMMDGERDTICRLSKTEFKDRLRESAEVDGMLKFAGHFQTIRIKTGEKEYTFGTTEGRRLMNFLELRDK